MSIEQWSDLMFPDKEGKDVHVYGSVRAINDDGSYEVQLNASSITTRCAPCCTALVGDRVLVCIKANGRCDAIGRLGGDLGGGGTIVTQYDDVSNYIAGRVFAYAGKDEPIGALLCDGRAVSRTTYWELFDAIGTTYGAGDGSSTFNLPNIESRTIIGESDSYTLGATGGEEEHTLTVGEIPSHNHHYHTYSSSGQELGGNYGDLAAYASSTQKGWTALTAYTGGSGAHNNMQPYIVMRYFITTGKGDPVSGINPADYVVEWKANDDGWYWEKWASGKAYCRKRTLVSWTTGVSSWGNTYESMVLYTNGDYPFEFAEVPAADVYIEGSGMGNYMNGTRTAGGDFGTTTSSPRVYLQNDNSSSDWDKGGYLVTEAYGFWKTPSEAGGTESIAPTIEDRFKEIEAEIEELAESGGSCECDVEGAIARHNADEDAHQDIRDRIEEIATISATPQMYGAVGDGVTDDTVAFQNALAANDNLFVPDGSYLITGTLDISYKKSLFANDGQKATILYNGSDSVVSIGRMSVFRNINVVIKNAFAGIVFDTNNYDKRSGEPALGSRVEHVNVDFEVESPSATLIGITIDSGDDANDIPRLKGACFQTYHDIHVDNDSAAYGCGIKMELIQGRAFTEETKEGFPWITHIDYDDISLGHPHTAIKSTVTNTSGSDLFERVNIGHILFNNVYSQYLDSTSTQVFLDLDNFAGYFTKVMGWDYHPLTWAGEKVNKIGQNVTACISGCEMAFGAEFLETCEFEAETEYTVADNPEYFVSKYFAGTILRQGYDAIDAKIDAKMADEYIASIADEKINEVLYSGYANILDDPLAQIRVGERYSSSSKAFVSASANTTVIIPIVPGGNVIRWAPSTHVLSSDYTGYPAAYFFNDEEMTTYVRITTDINDLYVETDDGGYLQISNPSGYKYASIPFNLGATEITPDTMTMTVNREITGEGEKSYTEYIAESVVEPAVSKKVEEYAQPKGDYLTELPEHEHDQYLTDYTETDPTVPSWAKAQTKPAYTAAEVGADPSGSASAALAEAKEYADELVAEISEGGGVAGGRGPGIYSVTTAPSSYTTQTGGFTPKYRIALSTVLSQSGMTEVLIGDNIRYSYYLYPVGYLDATYAYMATRQSIRGAAGADGATAEEVIAELPTKTMTVTYEDGTSETLNLVVTL